MPASDMFFNGQSGRDIHLLRSQSSRSLIAPGNLAVTDASSGANPWADAFLLTHPEVQLQFRPVFKATDTGTDYVGFGIRVNKQTGSVSFDVGPPSNPSPQNFLIEAILSQPTAAPPLPALIAQIIRVHVHNSIKNIWVTPSVLTVRRVTATAAEVTRYRFTVRAQFDDDVVGDVTLDHGITWAPADNFDPGSGFIQIPAGVLASPTPIGVAAHAPAAWGAASASAQVIVAPPWLSDPNMPRADLVDGPPRTWGPTPNPGEVPNVLFFGSGVTSPDSAHFEEITTGIVNWLKGDPVTVPYDLLSNSMNYWRVAPQAQSRGLSVRCEVYVVRTHNLWTDVTSEQAYPVPAPLAPVGATPWTLNNLLYMAGLPIPSDAATSLAVLRSRLLALMPVAPPSVQLDDKLIGLWRKIATRTFFDEVDSFPGLTRGRPPAAGDTGPHDGLDVDSDRGGQEEVDAFYSALQSSIGLSLPGGRPLGSLWASNAADIRFDNRPLVVFLVNSYGRGHAAGRYISIPLHQNRVAMPHQLVGGRNALTIDPAPLAIVGTEDRLVFRTVAHELAHQFGLGDEYVEKAEQFTLAESLLDPFSNLTSEGKVRGDNHKLNSRNIKWNWERISKAAVVAGPIVSLGAGLYNVPVIVPQGRVFSNTDTVRIRQRVWGTNLKLSPPTVGDYTVVSIGALGESIQIREGAPSTIGLPGEGSIIYTPVPAPVSVRSAAYPYARMIAPKVEQFIDTNNRPLTPEVCDVNFELNRGSEEQLAEGWRPLVPLLWSWRNVPRIVGLYAGGAHVACGIFHPTGWCIMRNTDRSSLRYQEFCRVCRYVVVDFVDPSLHGRIDRDYDEIYPG